MSFLASTASIVGRDQRIGATDPGRTIATDLSNEKRAAKRGASSAWLRIFGGKRRLLGTRSYDDLEYHDKPDEKTNMHEHPDFVLYALSALNRELTFRDLSAALSRL